MGLFNLGSTNNSQTEEDLGLRKSIRRQEAETKAQERILRAKRIRERDLALTNLGRSVGQFGRAAILQGQEEFSVEQQAMREMFGQGEKIWGTQGEPVRINHDLNPRLRGDYDTGRLFGL